MKQIISIFAFIAFGLINPIVSCCQNYYVPNEGNLLALGEKHDFKLSYAFGYTELLGKAFSVQAGYSPLKHLGVQYSFASATNKESFTRFFHNKMNGFAFGTYINFNLKLSRLDETPENKNPSIYSNFLFDFYVGFENGNIENRHSLADISIFEFTKRYAQLGLHWQGAVLGFNYVQKIGLIDYKKAIVSSSNGLQNISGFHNVIRYDTYNFTEHTLRMSLGIKHVQLYASATWMRFPKKDKIDIIDNLYHLGLIIGLDKFFRKKINKL